jgi:predicted Zn-dependent peptidase
MTTPRLLRHRVRRRRLFAVSAATAVATLIQPSRRAVAQVDSAGSPQVVQQRELLDNGLVVIAEQRQSAGTVAVQVTARAGSRDDGTLPGNALFTLRMINQGTPRWPSESALQRAAAAVGGTLQRGTTAEYGQFASTMAAEEATVAFELLSGLMSDPLFAPDVIERQKTILLQDQAQRRANPDLLIGDLYLETMFSDTPLGTPIQGTMAAVQAMDRDTVSEFFGRAWNASDLVLTVVGRIEPEVAFAMARRYFGPLPAGEVVPRDRMPIPAPMAPRVARAAAGQAQAQFRLGFPAPSLQSDDRYPMTVLDAVMGGQSGRLFNAVRNERGLAYVAGSAYLTYTDAGSWFALAGVEPGNLDAALEVVEDEVQRLRDEPIGDREVSDRIGLLVGQRILQGEGNGARAGQLAREVVIGEDSTDQFIARVRQVTAADIQRVAQQYLDIDRSVLVVVAPP